MMTQVLHYINKNDETICILDDYEKECIYFLNVDTKKVYHFIDEIKNMFDDMLTFLKNDCNDYDEIVFDDYDYKIYVKDYIENEVENLNHDFYDLYKSMF